MKKILLILAIISFNAYASDEVTAICDLHKAKAELTSSLLSSPYVYGSNNENNTASLALAYSLSGRVKGNLAKEIAIAKCDSQAVTSILDDQQRWAFAFINKAGAKVELVELMKARAKAKEVIDLTEQQLKSQVVTIAEYNSAKQLLLSIDTRINALRLVLSEPSQPVELNNINILLGKAKSLEGTVAELTAKMEAENSWDVTLAAGAQKDLANNNSSVSPFIGLNFRWSFSGLSTKGAVENIKSKTEAAFSSTQSGYVKTSDRFFAKIDELVQVDKDREKILLDNISDTDRLLSTFKGVTSSLAINTRTTLELQNMLYKAELVGVQARLSKYSGIKN